MTATTRARPQLDCRAVLRTAGVADPESLHGARLHDLSRSHAVTLVELPDGKAFVVKQVSVSAGALGRSLQAELFAYRMASWRPGLAAALPTAVHLDERRQVLAIVAAPLSGLFAARVGDPGFPSPVLAAALGRTLAAVHADTAGQPLLTEVACGVLQLPDTDEAAWHLGDESAGARAVARTAAGDPVLAPALHEAAVALRPSCLVHGDVKWDNAVLDPGPPARVLLFDWELSGRGDPAWDLGCALAETSSLPVRLGAPTATPAPGRVGPVASALLRGYGETGPADGALARRAVLCWVGRTVHLALECAGALGEQAPVVHDLLAAARGLAVLRDDVVPLVEQALLQ